MLPDRDRNIKIQTDKNHESWRSERDYLYEANAILQGWTLLHPEKRHLEVLHEHYQSEILRIVHEIEQVRIDALKRN